MANKKIIPVVDALKELYGKLGGTPADVEDISTTTEIIQEIADVASPGGGGGGGSAMIVNFHYGSKEVSGTEYEAMIGDKTFNEVFTALNSGTIVVGKLADEEVIQVFSAVSTYKHIGENSTAIYIYFLDCTGSDPAVEPIYMDFSTGGADPTILDQNIYHVFYE